MKLADVARSEEGTWVRVLEVDPGPPNSISVGEGDLILFYHLDGMYSYCRDRAGNVVHPRAWTEVEVVSHE